MDGTTLTRRSLIAQAVSCALATSLWGRETADCSDRERPMLLGIARLLYPHDALSDDVYEACIEPVLAGSGSAPLRRDALCAGFDMLDDVHGGTWLDADRDAQVTALAAIQRSAFFDAVRDSVRLALYTHPAVWRLIGFEGSSVEHGGYLERGFDDIDWLPEA